MARNHANVGASSAAGRADRIASRIRHRDAWGAPGWKFDPEKLRKWWDWHHSETQEHFGERILVLNIGDGWEPLCRYLDVPVPDRRIRGRAGRRE